MSETDAIGKKELTRKGKEVKDLFIVPFLPVKTEYVATLAMACIALHHIENLKGRDYGKFCGIVKTEDPAKEIRFSNMPSLTSPMENIFIFDIDSQASLFASENSIIDEDEIKSFWEQVQEKSKHCVWFSTLDDKIDKTNTQIEQTKARRENLLSNDLMNKDIKKLRGKLKKLKHKLNLLKNAKKAIETFCEEHKETEFVRVKRDSLYEDVKKYFKEKYSNVFGNGESLEEKVKKLGTWVKYARPKQNQSTVPEDDAKRFENCKMLIKAAAYEETVTRDESKYLSYIAKLAQQHGPWKITDAEETDIKVYEYGNVNLSGTSQQTQDLMQDIQQVAPHYHRALIFGETGTGKEIVAHHLHYCSPDSRKKNEFVTLNCAAMTETLIESKLFGYVEGGFTGAKKGGEKGLFEEADGGTLFLDEIGKMSLTAQGMLLRALENGEITRMGSTKAQKVDVNVIAATNVDLLKLAGEGKFLFDLYFRLCEVFLKVAPLRVRWEDIAVIANEIWMDKTHCRLTQEQKKTLVKYDYPGNVRELKLLLNRAYISENSGESFDAEDVDFQQYIDKEKEQMKSYSTGEKAGKTEEDTRKDAKKEDDTNDFPDNLKEAMYKHVANVRKKYITDGEAMEKLGISRQTFYKYKKNQNEEKKEEEKKEEKKQ